ncbi:PREDICTED: cytochrome c oxidase assembly protein COX16 homolog, mitochondrial-like, partial [Chlamydotis macqueenii]|uniref:cytochrome c oxidase assembly protein COX16 homolog, mitochondrial-like n=1 Tax=Chlamydotis macqueenii TaxID=187382 RepID=UPI00052971F5
ACQDPQGTGEEVEGGREPQWWPLEVKERVIKHALKDTLNYKLYLIGGSFGLREFTQIRYDVHKLHGKVDPALKEKLKQNPVTLESEYEKLEKSDLDNWENIRGPRLWEDSRTVQKQRREALRLKTE